MQKSFLMRRFLKDARLLNSSLKQMSGTLRGKKDKTKLVLLFHLGKIKKCLEINKFKQLKNWNLPIVRLASLFSVQTVPTYCYVHAAPTRMLAFTGEHRLFDRFAENVIVRNALGNLILQKLHFLLYVHLKDFFILA